MLERVARREQEHRAEHVPLDFQPGVRAVVDRVPHQRVERAEPRNRDGKSPDGPIDRAVVNDFDAIVLDLNLPGMDGLEVCRKLRTEGRTGAKAGGTR